MERRHLGAGATLGAAANVAATALTQAYPDMRRRSFKKVWDHMRAFRETQLQWFRMVEDSYDSFAYPTPPRR